MHRFMVGVDLASVLLAGVGLAAVAQLVAAGLRLGVWRVHRNLAKPAVVWSVIAVAVVAALAPAWSEVRRYDLDGATLIRYQRAYEALDGADFKALVLDAERRGGGRIYAGMRATWGQNYRIGSVHAFAELEDYDADTVGYPFRTIQALSTDVDASFEDALVAQFEILNIKYMIMPTYLQPTVPTTLIASRGRHRLYEVATTGYLQVADVIGSITANRTNIGSASYNFRHSDLATRNTYPSVAFNGGEAAPQTYTDVSPPSGAPGAVLEQSNDSANCAFAGTVRADRPAAVVLKESFDPRWTVTVDGVAAKPVMLAPSFVGVEIPAGTHEIAFRYKEYPNYPLLVLIGALTAIALAVVPRRKWIAERLRQRHGRPEAT